MFQDKVVVITGGAGGIGKCIGEEFAKEGAYVCVIDCAGGDHFVGDIGDKATLEAFAAEVIDKYGRVDVLVNNAPPLFIGIEECTYEQFRKSLDIGVTAAFCLTKLFLPYFAPGASILNLSSSRDRMSQPQSESYTAAKGAIAALTHSLAVSLAGKVRVKLHQPRLDRHSLHRLRRPRCHPAARRPGGTSSGHCPHGPVPVLGKGRLHHRRKYLHRWRTDEAHDLPW